jgi:hypothetical protein
MHDHTNKTLRGLSSELIIISYVRGIISVPGVVAVVHGIAVRISNTDSVRTGDTGSNWPIHADVNHSTCVWSGY